MSTTSNFLFPKITETGARPWPPGTYKVRLVSIEEDKTERTTPSKYGNGGPQAKWTFEVTDIIKVTASTDREETRERRDLARKSMTAGEMLLTWTSMSMHPKSKMRQFVQVLIGRELSVDDIVNPNDVLGHRAEAVMVAYQREDGKEGWKLDHLDPIDPLGDDDETEAPF